MGRLADWLWRSNRALAPVSGTVTLDGEPMADAGVLFQPVQQGATTVGSTNEQGRFALRTNNRPGAPLGEYYVLISKVEAPLSLPKTPSAV